VGATQAQAHKEYDGHPNTKGAAGTMAIILPPGIRHIHRLRVAGVENEKSMTVILFKGGFDPEPGAMKHLREEIASQEIRPGPYFVTIDIPEAHRSMRDRHRTLAVDIRSTGYATVSLVSIEVAY
jgi:hypothetical protein